MKILVSVISILLGFVAGALLMLSSGANPLTGFSYLFQGGLKSVTRICNTIAYAVPLMLTGLSVTFAFKTGLFNIGAPGQMLIGGLLANVLALTVDLPRPLLLPLVITASIVGGMVWAAVPGFLKARFNVNEVVSCIMMNWVAYWVVYIIISDHFKSTTIDTESQVIPAAASLKTEAITLLTKGSNLNLGIFIAIIATALVIFILNRTVLGYEMKAVGFNRFAAEYGGINVQKNAVLAMVISGALSGLAGLTFYCGYLSNMRIGVMPSQGFDGIAVALLANCAPVGVVFAAIFFAILQTGKGFMNAMMPIPPEIADTIIATVIYFAATSKLIEMNLDRIKKFFGRKRPSKSEGSGEHVEHH
ncbi:ABC transporter permease [Anaerotruncus massiliensis (ex Liu et al. 2021)]|uniref:ABC transporter permease n=3 Tax=Anaerotruncus TaxID=244127 RepID=A0A498CUS5_9FIRM|nr:MULTISPECIES: ABC transporter permease [Anaerotruncus]MBC3937621.1 ABC transporter permease [Anaerotruncus massiliensis (ex Togo et al. 2019)]MCQ4894287.1 ABC transporter permease [Anaerotruncus sp. DFI.9.16]RLL14729.1 ABC transporter permease [Anaerotruncus massiliensis (ex Liu et al. 2021)]